MPYTSGDLSLAIVAKVGPLSAHRITEIEKRTSDHWSGRGSMTAVLFLSLGLCAVLWEAVGWLASAVSW
jgi:hypothetical protein